LNTMQPEAKGTIILKEADSEGVKAVAAKDGIVMIKIKSSRMLLAYGFLRKIFEVFEKYKTSIDMITTSEVAVSVTVDNTTHLDKITMELQPLGELEVFDGQSIVSVVGNKLTQKGNLMENLFSALSGIQINMVSYGGSLHNVSILVPTSSKNDTLKALNKGLFGLQ
jgi:aspartate kinase